jgi:hypothetical protein
VDAEQRRRVEKLLTAYRIAPGPDAGLLLALLVSMRHARGRRPARLTAHYLARQFGKVESERIRRGIQAGPDAGYRLALEIAGSEARRLNPGRPRSWTEFELSVLAGEVRRELDAGARSITDACKRLAATPWWAMWLSPRSWDAPRWRKSAAPRGGWDVLRKAYQNADPRLRKVGEHAYQFSKVDSDARERWALLTMVYLPLGQL